MTCERPVVITLNPNYFHITLGTRQFSDIAEKVPMFLLQAAEVQVAEDIAQEDKAAKGESLQHVHSSLGTADFRTQVQVRKDHRVVIRRVHAYIVENSC